MRTRRLVSAGAGLALIPAAVVALALALPDAAAAAPHPHHNHGLTIAVNANPITAGQGVLIYGRLTGPDSAHKRVWLFHRINPAARFTPIGVRRTNGQGFYEFVRADGVVKSNRNWFVLGPGHTHSRTVHERVSSVVTLSSTSAGATTADMVDFTGTVFPAHANQRVKLQEQTGDSDDGWKTIEVGRTNAESAFQITHRFRTAGSYTLRAHFPHDPRNLAGQSPSIELTVQQQQNPSFTIAGSSQEIANGQSETVTGTLYAPGSTTAPQPNVLVTLYGRQGTGSFRALQSTTTDSSGGYSFTTMPLHNTVYHVRAGHGERTANLYVGVQDVVSAALSSATIAVGESVQVTGTVTPDHGGHILYLQEQDATGQWADVESTHLTPRSAFSLRFTPGQMGTLNLRVQISGHHWNVGGTSATLPLTVSGIAPVSSLPPAT